ncbi:MAG: ABC transporter substrate-binding protein [Rhodospirillales bacterium]
MYVRRVMAVAWLVGLMHAMSLCPVAADAKLAENAEAFIVRLGDEAISKLTDKKITIDEQEQRFRSIVQEYVAFNTIARWVLGGRYWKVASEAQQNRYLKLFEDLMVATYAHRFQNYSGEKMIVNATRIIDDTQAMVQTALHRPNADKPLQVDWRVRETEGRLRVIDIMVEGLSMAQSQRSEFSSVLRENGGSIDALMDTLESRLDAVRSERSKSVDEAARKS